ncbi:non-homologous end-joining DNA ligase LigD [Variovorax brevis]|uniref:non-homologous end-joining DNA ligase LigD n=1 Tax=Variovorax brevis TaxID=3053503 RepID=UPI00336533A7
MSTYQRRSRACCRFRTRRSPSRPRETHAIVQHRAKTIPSRFVAKSGPANRVGKLFVDYLRNGHGATTAAAFSARARPGVGVSVPVAWDDLKDLQSGARWTGARASVFPEG